MDEPGERTSHSVSTPSLGGIGIFAGMLFSIILWTPFQFLGDLQYILCAFILIFLIGARDDLDPISPTKKLLGELLAACILVFKANVKLTSLYGIFGIYELHPMFSIVLSIFTVIVIINAFNLIDGINGLSGSIGVLISTVLGIWFYKIGRLDMAILSFSMVGSLVAFLKYNVSPAKIFMGDTGSLLIGMMVSILAIQFIELQKTIPNQELVIQAAPAFVVATLILPLFDTLRVFVIRLYNGKSPFYPDRSHIHHLLIDSGFTHMKATLILLLVNVIFIGVAFYLQDRGNLIVLASILGLALLMTFFLHRHAQKLNSI
jgi:UDP-N-acetylmuramyl pentapeptide phosphotransferase/UDP-N-acetylglucosamine-1-phosphate transferase